MCSMTARGHPLARLQRAFRTGNAWLALDAASELERVPLADAFGICLLLREDQRRYDRACVRWLERFAAEVEGATLGDVQMVAEGFQAIRGGARVGDVEGMVEVLGAHRPPSTHWHDFPAVNVVPSGSTTPQRALAGRAPHLSCLTRGHP